MLHTRIGAVSTVCLLVLSGTVNARQSGDDLWIVFGSFRGGDFSGSVHAIRPDGSSERQLSLHPSGRPASLDPWSSTDGSVVLFTRGGATHRSSVWALDLGRGQERRETPEVMVRFDNGRAWPSLRPGHPGQFSYVREIGNQRRIALGSMGDDDHRDLGPGELPSWSPDGRRVAYVRERQVWLQTIDADDGRPLPGPLRGMSYPSWSPDGDRLLVTAQVDSGWDLFEVDLDGTPVRRLTRSPGLQELAAAWSPDKTLVAFSGRSGTAANDWEHSIYVLDVRTGDSQEVTSGRFHDSRPTWMVRRAP